MRNLIGLVVMSFLIIAVGPHRTFSSSSTSSLLAQEQTPSPTPAASPTPDLELERLTREAQLAAQKKAKSEAERDAVAADLAAAKNRLGIGEASPKAAASPPAGSVTGGETLIETQVLAEAAAREATHNLANRFCESPLSIANSTLVINNGMNRTAVEAYRGIVAQVSAINSAYRDYIDEAKNVLELPEDPNDATKGIPPSLILPSITETVKSVADLINLFRTDTTFSTVDVSAVNQQMIVTFLAGELLGAGRAKCKVAAIYYPSLYSPTTSAKLGDSPLLKQFNQLRNYQAQGDAQVALLKAKLDELTKAIKDVDAVIADLEEKVKKDPKLKGDLGFNIKKRQLLKIKSVRVAEAQANLEAFKTSTADIVKMLTDVNETTKLPVITEFLKAEQLVTILDQSNAYALDLTVSSAGMLRVRKNIFFNAKTAHSGGVSISARLFNNEGKLVFGGVQDYYVDFTGSKQIRESLKFKQLKDLAEQ
jgi:hypothetical protein